ncbi:MAG: biliverdin-producing heme oxygenase [Gemmatimonadota bacterium]|nr:biliverdin-producing heme oxygenase [Gemmatimonadota bacterium]
MKPALSHRLRSETKVAHAAAERSGIMRTLLRGAVTRAAYVALLHNLAALYSALEAELVRHHADPALAQVDWRILRRVPALQHDIACFDWQSPVAICPATAAYVERIHELGATEPSLLFAHAYLRYLGDLYGGQIIQGIIKKTFSEGSCATSFYEFTDIGNINEFKIFFREAIDAIPEGSVSPDALVAEARLGYELHKQIFSELEATAPKG